jgi:enamine deaminase RidA (YjgF/YER057c/UK114 family)
MTAGRPYCHGHKATQLSQKENAKMTIDRLHSNQRMSQVVIHGDTVYLAGQVAKNAPGGSIAAQTEDILKAIESLLDEAGSSKEQLLRATIWLSDIRHFEEMNGVWDAWVPSGHAPCRACIEARLASTRFDVEIMVTAAL